MDEILHHNPFPVMAAPDQGSNMGSLARNMDINSVEVTLKEQCMARMQKKLLVLALPNQEAFGPNLKSTTPEPLSQLVFTRSCKITTLLGTDGSTRGSCSIIFPGGMEFKLTLPDKIKNALSPRDKESIGDSASFTLNQPIWTTHNQKITRVYNRKNKTPRPPLPQNQPIIEEPH
jgi:hypothetical protein